jgi:branched-chain amino acid aminotransferase
MNWRVRVSSAAMYVWLNGSFVPRDEAHLSVFDAGFQHGVGLFETLLARQGKLFRPEAHIARLADSAKQLLLTERLRTDALIEAIQQTLKKNKLSDARIRITLTGGDLNMLQSKAQSAVDPTILIVAQPPTLYPDGFFKQGVRVTIADGRDNPLHPMAGHKTLNYWPRIRALQLAAGAGAGESLWFTISNHLASGCVSNVFLVKDKTLMTPIARSEEQQGALPSCVLPGITRAAIIELAQANGMTCLKRMLDINDLLSADEVFLTNSSWGVLPVVGVEKEDIGNATVGEVTQHLRTQWLEITSQS